MNDNNNVNEGPRVYTEEEVFRLFQRFKNEEKLAEQNNREERPLPVEIITQLEENSKQQLQDNFRRFKKNLSKYIDEEWTVAEEINKSLLPKLKTYTVDTAQLVSSIYRGSEIMRTHGRAATEIFEQLSILREGEISTEEAHAILEEAFENAKRLAVFAWAQGRQQDEEARDFAIKALRLPSNLKHLETKESGKREAFSTEFIEQYHEAKYQQSVLRAATTNNSQGNGRGGHSNHWNQQHRGGRGYYRGGKNYSGGRGRGAPTYHNLNSHNQRQPTYVHQTENPEQKQ
ncbi:hypothetical protein G6F37_013104 [Rhizopus arrhizus]|nr:hypothetical protein G6F38_013103 [Rhizopus arrhizus]KAG1139733.1 hypothetical protein G6F37_013104 [Rhizopus arrhizus]